MISLETLELHLSSYSHSRQWQPEQEVIKAQELILVFFGILVQSLILEDPICHGATEPVHPNY